MDSTIKTKKLKLGGMTCVNCQNKIQKKLWNTAGIQKVDVSYNTGSAVVAYDTDIISLKDIVKIIQKMDYEVLENRQPSINVKRAIGILIIVIFLYMLLKQLGFTGIFNAFPTAETGMGYGMLFVIGLLTSVHCIAMCGGINLLQCIPQAGQSTGSRIDALMPGFLYNLGRVISYTVVGGIVGALGSAVSLSGGFKGIIQIVAGMFMVIMGINMLDIFPWLRRFNPRMPVIFARKINTAEGHSKSPLYVGLLNGLMPCGPLQAMQLYALSTGSPVKGALSMFIFSIGTVPLMFGLGAISSILSKKFTKKAMTAGAVLVVVLGISMFSQGWSLSGFSFPSLVTAPGSANDTQENSDIVMEDGIQIINSTLSSGRYPAITVQVGIPVKWMIDAPQGSINGCNNRMSIPEYDIEYEFAYGENVIEFTPTETGVFRYSCWMGMIRSTITVTESGTEDGEAPEALDSMPFSGGTLFEIEKNKFISLAATDVSEEGNAIAASDDVTTIEAEVAPGGYPQITVEVNKPVRINFKANAEDLNACNNEIVIPEWDIRKSLSEGDNYVEFTPTETGTFNYSCWMGMLSSSITVVEQDTGDIGAQPLPESASTPSGCGMMSSFGGGRLLRRQVVE